VLPHHPYWEQQFPNELPVHSFPDLPAQVPSGLTLSVEEGEVTDLLDVLLTLIVVVEVGFNELDLELDLELEELDEPQVPPSGLHPKPQ